LAGAFSPPTAAVGRAREAVLRAVVADDAAGYFLAYCVAAIPGDVAPEETVEGRIGTIRALDPPDAPASLLARLAGSSHRFLPASACEEREEDGDIVVRATQRGPALLVTLGPVQVTSSDRAEIVVFTAGGFLTETVTAYSLRREADGQWKVVREEVLLQA